MITISIRSCAAFSFITYSLHSLFISSCVTSSQEIAITHFAVVTSNDDELKEIDTLEI
jgi:hypothetical protein